MREKPIIFTGESVRAILEGRKTMTRRVIKNPHYYGCLTGDCPHNHKDDCAKSLSEQAPYQVGQRLWVKEAYATYQKDTPEESHARAVAAVNIKTAEDLLAWSNMPSGHGDLKVMYKSDFGEWADNPDSDLGPWKSPLFMPRWASRIDLEVTAVRVERLQDISGEDAKSEGVEPCDIKGHDDCYYGASGQDYKCSYQQTWNRINGKKHPWSANCFVWVIEFARVKP